MALHHFVPQTYLRGFASNDDPNRVFYYDRRVGKTHKRSIEDICGQKNLYRLHMDDGELSDALEESFATIAEPLFRQILQKLANRQPLSRSEKSEFAAYIALQMIRTPFARRISDSIGRDVYDSETKKWWERLLDDDYREKEFAKLKQDTGTELDLTKLTRDDIQGIIDGTTFTVEWNMPKENWIKNQMEVMAEVFPALEQMHWHIYFAPPQAAFITSDNPIGILVREGNGYMLGTGILAPNGIRLFPLSSKACLEMRDDVRTGFSFGDTTREKVRQINRVTAMSCDQILIGSNERLVNWWAPHIKDFNLADMVAAHYREKICNNDYA
jgi:hypothetical protein